MKLMAPGVEGGETADRILGSRNFREKRNRRVEKPLRAFVKFLKVPKNSTATIR